MAPPEQQVRVRCAPYSDIEADAQQNRFVGGIAGLLQKNFQ
jgi:hypothetical protein